MATPLKVGLYSILGVGVAGGGLMAAPSLLKFWEKTLLQTLTPEEFEALNTDIDRKEHDTEWTELVKKHLSDESIDTKIKGINIIAERPERDNAENIKALKNKCKEILSKTKDFEKDKETVMNWCNKKSKLLAKNTPPGVGVPGAVSPA